MKIVFMGTPDFSVPALESLYDAGHDIAAVVTQPDAARDRGKKIVSTPVKKKAEELGIEVLQPVKIKEDRECIEKIKGICPDAIVVIAYGQILSKEILDIPRYGCINIHASLLPRFRGAAPIQRAILEGDELTGVTIMQMEEGLDTGDMLAKEITETAGKTGGSLHDELSVMGGRLILKVLEDAEKGELKPEKQDDSLSNYAPMISKKEGRLDFSESADRIEHHIRAFDPWPGSFTEYKGKTMKVWKAHLCGSGEAAAPGTITDVSDEGIFVCTGNGSIVFTEIQMPGKKRVDVKDFLKGNTIEKGVVLG